MVSHLSSLVFFSFSISSIIFLLIFSTIHFSSSFPLLLFPFIFPFFPSFLFLSFISLLSPTCHTLPLLSLSPCLESSRHLRFTEIPHNHRDLSPLMPILVSPPHASHFLCPRHHAASVRASPTIAPTQGPYFIK